MKLNPPGPPMPKNLFKASVNLTPNNNQKKSRLLLKSNKKMKKKNKKSHPRN